MATIEERAKAIAEEWKKDIIRGGEDLSFTHLEYVAKQAATEQDRIARAEERERCVKAAQDVYCDITCNHRCDFTQRCQIMWEIRKAIEGGNV